MFNVTQLLTKPKLKWLENNCRNMESRKMTPLLKVLRDTGWCLKWNCHSDRTNFEQSTECKGSYVKILDNKWDWEEDREDLKAKVRTD